MSSYTLLLTAGFSELKPLLSRNGIILPFLENTVLSKRLSESETILKGLSLTLTVTLNPIPSPGIHKKTVLVRKIIQHNQQYDSTQKGKLLKSFSPRGWGTPLWIRQGCSSEILNLTPKGDHLGVAQTYCDS